MHQVYKHSSMVWECEFHYEVRLGDMSKEGHRELFERFCRGRYLDHNHTTTVTEEKVQKITDVLNRVERNDISNRPFITETKKFFLLNYPELKLEDVLYLPAN